MIKRPFSTLISALSFVGIVLLLNGCSGTHAQNIQTTITTTAQAVYASPKGPGEPITITQALDTPLGQGVTLCNPLEITGLPSGTTASQSCTNNVYTVVFSGNQVSPASPGQTVISIQLARQDSNVINLPLEVEYPELDITVPTITTPNVPGTITLTNTSNVPAQINGQAISSSNNSWRLDSSASTCTDILAPKKSCATKALNNGIYEAGEFAIQPIDSWYLSNPTAMLVPEVPETDFSFTELPQKQKSSSLLLDEDVTLTNNSEFSLPADAIEAEFIGDYGDGATTVGWNVGDCLTNGIHAKGGYCTFRVNSEDTTGLSGTTDTLRVRNNKAGNTLIGEPEFGIPTEIIATLSGGERKGAYQQLLVTVNHKVTLESPAYVFTDNNNDGNKLIEVKEPPSDIETEADTCSGQTISAGGQCYIWLHSIKQNTPISKDVKVQIEDASKGSNKIISGSQSIIASTYLYAGGDFTSADGNDANYIAKWDGNHWSALGDGMNNLVLALAADSNGIVYAGGRFTTADGVSANYIAKWDGSSWSALAEGVNNAINALATDSKDNIYAGGRFTTAGGVSANYVAKWDGNSWSALGSGVDNNTFFPSVLALAVDSSDNLYVGGAFDMAGGMPANYIAKWDGNSWSALGDGANDSPYVLATDSKDNVYAGGAFDTVGGVLASNIAKWDGNSWSALGDGIDGGFKYVAAITANSHDTIYVGGSFTIADGSSANYIAKWENDSWSSLDSGMDDAVHTLTTDGNDEVYAGGYFYTAGGMPARYIAKWDGNSWSALGDNNINNYVSSLIIAPSILIP
ncbi:MAG: hypothetical protein AAGA27_03870 [Pseudomonadota bacterium]